MTENALETKNVSILEEQGRTGRISTKENI